MAYMTQDEIKAKELIINKLNDTGYPRWAELILHMPLHLTRDRNHLAYYNPQEGPSGSITVNRGLNLDQISTVIRHELCHRILEHAALTEKEIESGKLPKDSATYKLANIAADYDLSNRMYTDHDKEIARKLDIYDETVRGLVTEDDHPNWVNLSFEEMFKCLLSQQKRLPKASDMQDSADGELSDKNSSSKNNSNLNSQQKKGNNSNDTSRGNAQGNAQGNDQGSDQGNDQGSSSDGGGSLNTNNSSRKSGRNSNDKSTTGSGNRAGNQTNSSNNSITSGGNSSNQNNSNKEDPISPMGSSNDSQTVEKSKQIKRIEDTSRELTRQYEQNDKIDDSTASQIDGVLDKVDATDLNKIDVNQLKELAEELEKLLDQIKQHFDDVQRDAAEHVTVTGLKRLLDDPEFKKALLKDAADKVQHERQLAADARKPITTNKKPKKYSYDPSALRKFEQSLNAFIRNQVQQQRQSSWRRVNKNYAYSGLIKPGRGSTTGKIPKILAFYDVSGSFTPDKIAAEQSAVATLHNYVNKKQIELQEYYFASEVSETTAGTGYGTNGLPIFKKIQEENPDNVIIFTDSDISDLNYSLTVPGGVWLIFVPSEWNPYPVSQNLVDNLHGDKLTETFILGVDT